MTAQSVVLASGRTVVVSDAPEGLRVEAADGTLELEVDLSGPVPRLRLTGVDLALAATGAVTVDAETIALRATQEVTVASGGDVTVAGAADVRVTGTMIHLN